MVEGTSTELAMYKRVVLLAVFPDLLRAARMELLKVTLKEDFGLSGLDCGFNCCLHDVCNLLHRNNGLLTNIPFVDSDGTAYVHVGQLKLPPNKSFLAPPLALVLQAVRHIFSRYDLAALLGCFKEATRSDKESEENPDGMFVSEENPDRMSEDNPDDPEDSPGFGELGRPSFTLSGESVVKAYALHFLALAAAFGNFGALPADLLSLLSGVPVNLDCHREAPAALVQNHFQNILKQSMEKRITEWAHWDFLEQHRELKEQGDFSEAIYELNAKLIDPSLKINLRNSQRLANLMDPQKTPPSFRPCINDLRQFLHDDADELPFTKTMLNHPMFFMGSSVAKTTGLMKQMYSHSERSFTLTCKALADEWLQACLSHKPQGGDNKWPKPPNLDTYLMHRHNVSFLINLVDACWKKAAGDMFMSDILMKFKRDCQSFYGQIKSMRDEFNQEVHLIPLEEDARNSFLLKLSRKHFPCLDDFLNKGDQQAKEEEELRSREENRRTATQRRDECVQFLEVELQEAELQVKAYDELVSKLKVSRQVASQTHAQEYLKQKEDHMKHILIHRIAQQDQESRERFAGLDTMMNEQVQAFRRHIAKFTKLPETDVYILINLNFSLRRMGQQGKFQATKIGTGLQLCMCPQDAVLYRPPEWVSKNEEVDVFQRELRDALFGMPQRGKVPSFNKNELSLSRTFTRKAGGQFACNRITAIFARKAKGKCQTADYYHADSWLETHEEAQVWGSEDMWATTSMSDLPLNIHGIWNDQLQEYVSSSNATKRDRLGSSGIQYDAEIFSRLCKGPLDANKAVGIYDPGFMMGDSAA